MRKLAFSTLIVVLLASLLTVSAQAPEDDENATQEAPTSEVRVIRVWWPDALYALNDDSVSDVLENQVEEFNRLNPSYDAELRIKRAEGLGSSLTTMLAAQLVAPGALPDLVLLRRSDLVTAARNDVIQPIDDWVPDAIRADLLPGVIALGEVDETLYGLPYAVTIQHAVYDPEIYTVAPTSFAAVLESQQPFLIPALPPPDREINDILLGQYLAAGGRLVDNAGVPALDEEPLREVLSFYEDGIRNGVFAQELVAYSSPAEYWSRLGQGTVPLAIVNSSMYLQRQDVLEDAQVTTIPTADGSSMVIVDGWLWALTTDEPEQQRGALDFLESLISAEPLADYTEAFGILPARQRALRIWSLTGYTGQIDDWMENIIIIPVDERNNAASQQLYAAFLAVIDGTPVNEAAEDAMSGLSVSG